MGSRILSLYGSDGVSLLRNAPLVKLINGAQNKLVDIHSSPELAEMRASLLSEESFDWSVAEAVSDGTDASLQFRSGDKSVTIFFDFERSTIQTYPEMSTAKVKRKVANSWRS